jgi:hypothetical protein
MSRREKLGISSEENNSTSRCFAGFLSLDILLVGPVIPTDTGISAGVAAKAVANMVVRHPDSITDIPAASLFVWKKIFSRAV